MMPTKSIKPTESPYPWFVKTRNLTLLILVLFLLFAAIAYTLCYKYYQNHAQQALQDDRIAADMFALILEEHFQRIVKTMESYAHRPLLIRAIRSKDTAKIKAHLNDLCRNNSGIDSVVVTDRDGTYLIAQPVRPDVIGMNFAHRDWYQGVSREWKPYISNAALMLTAEKDTAIYLAVPIFEDDGKVIGILLNTQRAVTLAKTIRRAPLSAGSSVTVTDRNGVIIYSSRYAYTKALTKYPFHDFLKDIKKGGAQTIFVMDPPADGTKRYISFAAVAGIGWRVSVGRDRSDILSTSTAYFVQTAALYVLLFLTLTMLLLYFKKRATVQIAESTRVVRKDLLVAETRFRELFDHMSSGVAIYSAVNDGEDFIITDLNAAGQRITRVQEGFAGKSVREVFPSVQKFGLFQVFGQVWRTGVAVSHPTSMYEDQHLSFWAENYVYKLPSGHVVAIFDDVTELKQAEIERLQLTNIIDSSFNEIYVMNAATLRFEYANQSALKNIGYTAEEIKNLTPFDLNNEFPDEIARKIIQPLITQEKQYLVLETVFKRKDGTHYPVQINLQLYRQVERSVFYALVNDITERRLAEDALRENERRLREAQEMAHLGFWSWNIKTGNVEWSDEVFRIFHLDPKEFRPQIESILALSPWPEDHQRDQELIRRAIESHQPGSYEQKFLRPDQSIGYYYSTFQGNYHENGDLVSIIGTVLDITERKLAEERINRLNAELEQRVIERTAELSAKTAELERINKIFVNRELKMRELKARIAELEKTQPSLKGGNPT